MPPRTGADADRLARAFAKVLTEFFWPRTREEDEAEALTEACWFVWSMRDPVGSAGRRDPDKVQKAFRGVVSALRDVDQARTGLPDPVRAALERHVHLSGGLVIPGASVEALEARQLRLVHAPTIPVGTDATVADGADPDALIPVPVCTRGFPLSAAVRELLKATERSRRIVREMIRGGAEPGRRNWEAILVHKELEAPWEGRTGARPAHFPKPGTTFYRFVERSFEALEVGGLGSDRAASVRATCEAVEALRRLGPGRRKTTARSCREISSMP